MSIARGSSSPPTPSHLRSATNARMTKPQKTTMCRTPRPIQPHPMPSIPCHITVAPLLLAHALHHHVMLVHYLPRHVPHELQVLVAPCPSSCEFSWRELAFAQAGLVDLEHHARVRRDDSPVLAGVVQAIEDVARKIDARRLLLVGSHDPPRRKCRVRAEQHLVPRAAVRLPVLERLGVDRARLPLLQRVAGALRQTP